MIFNVQLFYDGLGFIKDVLVRDLGMFEKVTTELAISYFYEKKKFRSIRIHSN